MLGVGIISSTSPKADTSLLAHIPALVHMTAWADTSLLAHIPALVHMTAWADTSLLAHIPALVHMTVLDQLTALCHITMMAIIFPYTTICQLITKGIQF